MSSKSAKKVRKTLEAIKFPPMKVEHARYHDASHHRRIRALAKTQGISIDEAITRYTQKVGMVPKPTVSDLDKRIEDLKRSSAERDPATGL